jgi:hypothetical protein
MRKHCPEHTVIKASWTSRLIQPHTQFNIWIRNVAGLDIRDSDSWQVLSNTVFIFDEAQLSYVDNEFWVDYLKPIATSPHKFSPLVILFSSYGSPGTFAHEVSGSSPVPLSRKQHVSVRPLASNNGCASLYFTLVEFEDAVERFSRLKSNEYERYRLDPALSRYLFEFTSGHPAAVRMVLELLGDSKVSRYTFSLLAYNVCTARCPYLTILG